MYGCDVKPNPNIGTSTTCHSPKAWGLLAEVYFIGFIILGAWVMLTLFVGVVTSSMNEVGGWGLGLGRSGARNGLSPGRV